MGPFQERNFFFFFFDQNKKLTLSLFRCRDSQRRDHLDQYLVLLYHFIHRAKYFWAQERCRSEQVVTWSPGHLVTWSDHPCVWALICLAQWIKIYSSSRCYSISSLLWESWRPKNGKVKTLVTKVTVTKKKKKKVVLCCFCLLLNWSSWQWASKKSSPTFQTCFGGSPGLVKGPYIGRFSRDNLNFEKKLKIQNNFKLPLKWKSSQVM